MGVQAGSAIIWPSAASVYITMDTKDASNYDKLKEEILKRYDITDESYW